jgi:hypothetical protein
MSTENKKLRRHILIEILIGLVLIVFVLQICFGIFHWCPHLGSPNRLTSLNNGRAISYAWRETIENTKEPISVSSIYEFAAIIADKADLNDPKYWVLKFDPKVAEGLAFGAIIPNQIIEKNENAYIIDEHFKKLPISWVAANGFSSHLSGNVPILWTRGLKPDGTWDVKDGVFEGNGGHIVFADMSVQWFDSLKDDEHPKGILKKYGSDEPTFNIYEAIPGGEKSVLKSE